MKRDVFESVERRSFMAHVAKGLLGVSCAGLVQHQAISPIAWAAQNAPITPGKAKSVIYLYMNGAMSHLDTFDPKSTGDQKGETKPGQTKVPGMHISDKFEKLSQLADKMAIVRSLTTTTGAHEQGKYIMHTSYKQLNSIRHPALGAWAANILPKHNANLPTNVLVGSAAGHPGAGFLPAAIAPVPVTNPALGLENTQSPSYLTDNQFKKRMGLARDFDEAFKRRYVSSDIKAYDETYREAVKLMGSSELKVFDIKEESEEIRKAYGENTLGQGCLLARRLVQKGVRFIEVEFGSWDHHQDIYTRLPDMIGKLDMALSSLIRDLQAKGLLSQTLIVLATEFGRTPTINENSGRDHHPGVFSGLMCGAGIQGGAVYGASDAKGASPDSDAVGVEDFNATIAKAMGLPLETEFHAPNGRPFRICNTGKPITKLLS
ncbi:MAG: DUF1501 domain-containing protein [Pirellulaceae bacterium]|nr:DUF1501 domain-containing protein [Pirellulaceae bacterium]